jgi:hypothetical protein
MRLAQIQLSVRQALADLLQNDLALLERDASERAIAARLTFYLVPLFERYDVDPEYNRHGLDPKIVDLPNNCREGGKRLIIPDIIVHHRGNDDNNVLVIEMKKQSNRESRDCDRAKILAMKRELLYQHGLIIDLPVGPKVNEEQVGEEWL